MLNLSTKIKSKFWYWQYQTLVRTLPNIGTATKHLYAQYKASVHTVQSICTHRQDTFLCMKLKQ